MTSLEKKKQDPKEPNETDDLWTKKWVTVKEDDLRFDLTATQQKRWAKLLPSKALKSSNDRT
jgi:hypothetical protein